MFFPQEYQHVHLLWFKKRSFTLVWKPNPPLRSVRCVHLRARADTASINQALPTKLSRWKRLSSRDQWNLTPATMCKQTGAAQTMHSHKCDHVKFLFAHSQKMVKSRALSQNAGESYITLQSPHWFKLGQLIPLQVKSHHSQYYNLYKEITCKLLIFNYL